MYGEQHTTGTGERTVAQRIFFDRYWVLVPELHFRTDKELELMGRYSNNDPELDRQLMMNKIRIYIPIAGMCQYLEEGVRVELDTPTDSIVIYKLLVQHLQNWVWLTNQLNPPEAPLDDLRIMDRFAEILYPVACTYERLERQPVGGLFGKLQQLGSGTTRIERQSALEQRPLLARPKREEEAPATEGQSAAPAGHSSLASIIARQTFKNPWSN